MTADDFNAWLEHTGFSGLEAARQLGTANNTIVRYRRDGAPHYIGLACSAICQGLPPWRKVHGPTDDASGDR
jgi:hypothetical protein